jgi:2,4-dienoyl-CoA reductase-like NADH-dependent reductase (Old Yellow Enzyme family)
MIDITCDPITIKGVRFKNRVLRSSVGGRSNNYDGTVTDVWKNFERRFAEGGVGGIISTTFHVNQDRLSPPQYPSIAGPKFVPYLRKYIAQIRDPFDCKYIVQIGDPGYTTYSSLFHEEADAKSSSGGFDLAYGYNSRRLGMSKPEIDKAIRDFADAAARVREACADGIEITITKGYLIHQFLNPAINRRNDQWGGDAERRFHFLQRVLEEVRARVGPDYLVGVRLSGEDLMARPLALALVRLPWRRGNDLNQMLDYAQRLKSLGVDYLHVVAGYGFPNPRDVPGRFPFDEVRMFFNSVRHLSWKASVRASVVNLLSPLLRWPLGAGWKYREGINLELARRFKARVGLPVIANGGFQSRSAMEDAIDHGSCDMISLARSLIANPDLLQQFAAGADTPARPCNFCNKCVGRTGTSPLGCYDVSRFPGRREMFDQIMEWNRPDPA